MLSTQKMADIRKFLSGVFAIMLALFHLLAGIWGIPNTYLFRYTHLSLMMIIVVLIRPMSKKHLKMSFYVDMAMAIAMAACLIYIVWDVEAFIYRFGNITDADMIFGIIYLIILLELSRRVAGVAMVIVAVVFFGQNLIAEHLPGFLMRKSLTLRTMVDFVFVRVDGLIGAPITAMSTYVVLFMIFAALLTTSHAGDFFIDIATAITGKSRGGPAKAAVVASACFGTLSGSAVANVASTGSVTIPLMKSIGYDKEFAGAVEAVASTGGQIMPPMMGAAAFILAQNVAIPYIQVAAAAAIPAVLYFVAVYFQVDLRAGKLGLKGTPKEDIPNFWKTLKEGWMLLIPIILMVYFLAQNKSAQFAALIAIASLLIVSSLHKKTRMDGRRIMEGIMQGIKDCAGVSVTSGAAGVIIGGISNTGLNLIFAHQIIKICNNSLPLALMLVAFVALVLGMGMTTTAVYVTVAVIMAPALVNMGVNLLAAHLFCFYFGCINSITPPVCVASFTAAGISGGSPSKTGWISFRLGLLAFLIPFIFVYQPSLILQQGSAWEIVLAALSATLGCWAFGVALEGYQKTRVPVWQRIIWAAGAIALMIPGVLTDVIGAALVAVGFVLQLLSAKKENSPAIGA